jgi:hypothetical protein
LFNSSSARVFWSASLVAAAVVLFGSVELGKVVGANLVARAGHQATVPTTAAATPVPAVIGGQRHTPNVP